MKISPDNLGAVASLINDFRFERLMQDVETSRVDTLERVLNCPEADLSAARAALRTITDFQKAVSTAPEQEKEMEKLNLIANTGSPDRVT